jgi:protein phosphatase
MQLSNISGQRDTHVRHPRFHEHSDVTQCDIIGDIHGCYDELVQLLATLGHESLLDPEVEPALEGAMPRIIFVGDIVDRGDRIMDAVKLVYRLCRRGYALSVIGNHDDRFLRWLLGKKIEPRHGLQETIDEFEAMPPSQREEWQDILTDFFCNLPWAVRIDHGRAIVAHAAWHGDLHEASPDKLRAYTLYGPTTGRKTSEGFPERIDWAPGYTGPELVVFGHQVYDAPYIHQHAIGIDTGCVFGGALTALRYPELEVVSVKSHRMRYSRGGKKMV